MECSIRRNVILFWILIEILSFGGIIFGWGALVFVLKEEDFFSELCRKNQTDVYDDYVECTERDETLNLYFAISILVGNMIPIVTSHCVAKLGTRTTRLITSICYAVGCLLIAMANNDFPWLICVGGILLTGFGLTFFIISLQVNVLFPKHSSTVIGLINGMYDSSAVVPLIVKGPRTVSRSTTSQWLRRRFVSRLLKNLDGRKIAIYLRNAVVLLKFILRACKVKGVDRRTSFLILMGFTSITAISAFLFFPITKHIKEHNAPVNPDNEAKTHANTTRENENFTQSRDEDGRVQTIVTTSISNRDRNDIPNERQIETNVISFAANENDDYVKPGGHNETPVVTHTERNQTCNFEISQNKVKGIMNEPKQYGSVEKSVLVYRGNNGEDGRRMSLECSIKDVHSPGPVDKDASISLRNSVLSVGYVLHIFWFSILALRLLYTIGTMNPKIEKLTEGEKISVSYYTDVLSYTMFCGLISSFGTGFLYDYQASFFRPIVHPLRRVFASSIIPLCVTSGLAVILSGLMFIQNEYVLYVLPVAITVFRSALYTVSSTFFVNTYPALQFEQLYAFVLFVGNVFGFLQYALFQWANAYADGEKHVSISFFLLCCLTFVHPIRLYVKQRRLR